MREAILAAARKLFIANGYEGVSMRQIADEIAYTPGIIYTHFASKQDLFKHLCREVYNELLSLLQPVRFGNGSALERIREGLRQYFQFGLANPELYRLAFIIVVPVDASEDLMSVETPTGQLFSELRRMLAEGVRDGEIRPVDLYATSQALWAAVHGLNALMITDKTFPWLDPEVLINALLDALIDGLRARPVR